MLPTCPPPLPPSWPPRRAHTHSPQLATTDLTLAFLAPNRSLGSLATGEYTKAVVEMARRNPAFVMGFVAGHRMSSDPADDGWVVMSPGVNLGAFMDDVSTRFVLNL